MNVFGRSGETSESLQSNVLMTPSKNVHNSVYIDHPELSDLNYIPHDRWYPNYESHAFASHPNLWSNVQSSTRQPSTHGRSLHVPYSNLAHSGSINSHAIPSFAVHHSNDDTRGQMGNEKSYFTALNRPWTIKATARERDQLIERAERLRNEYDLITKRLRMLEIVDLDEKKSVFSVPITRRTNADSVYIGSGLQAPHCSENYSNNIEVNQNLAYL
ncbi:hypothetical protein M3Y94_00846800 [Aphelenchoides besseyi]|nr:hypothetical protein M3Y94_00846800 [Aphelenchoides besseyi]